MLEDSDPEPEPVPDPTPPPDPKPDSKPDLKPDPLEQQSSTSPQPLLNVGRNAFFAAVIAAAMSVSGALWLAEISYMDFGEALGNGGMGFAAWLTAVFSFAHARKCQEEAQRESDPQRQSFLKRQASSLVNLSYILVLLMPILIPILIPMIFSDIDAFY